MSKRFLICLTADWNNLTAQEQSVYEGHYETIVLFLVAKDGFVDVSGDDYVLEHLGESYEETISSRQKVHINLSGGKLIFSALGKWLISDDYSSNYIFNLSDNGYCPVIFNNVTFKALDHKDHSFRGFIMTDHDRYIQAYNCTFDMNNKNCGSIVFMSDNQAQRHVVHKCLFKNSGAGTDVGGIFIRDLYAASGVHWIVNNTFINVKYCIYNDPSSRVPEARYYNNYFDSTVSDVHGSASYNIDLGGNVSSSTISINSAFVNAIDYIPTELLEIGVAPQIVEDASEEPYYTGAQDPAFGYIKTVLVRRRNIRNKTKKLVLGF